VSSTNIGQSLGWIS